ncbi:MAG: YtxH domain-containing protein [Gemmatimonadota bacterium]
MVRHRDDDIPYLVVERTESGGVLPFLWGALVGAGVALLLAPRSGRETRAEITGGVRRLRDKAEDTVRGVQESVADAVEGVREQVGGRVTVARSAFDAGKTAARESRADMERRIRAARASFESGQRAARRGDEYSDIDLEDLEDEEI